MYRRDTETFKNPVQLVRPLTVDPNRRLERSLATKRINKHRPRTSGIDQSKNYTDDFQSNSTSTTFSFGSDRSYDTDFEDDDDRNNEDICIEIYKRVCKIEKIVPVRKYLEHYTDNELSLEYYGLGPKGMRGFIPSLTMNQYITKLDLASNGLGDEGVIYLAHILRDNVTIVDINLSQNFVGVAGIRELCDLFKQSHITINHLNLAGNLLNDECAQLLGDAISGAGQLHTLNLARNRLGLASGFYLGEAIAENTTMRSFDLSWNGISGRGAVALIKGIQKNVFLKTLNLSYNGLCGAECGRAWIQAFKENTTLIELDLSHNRLTTEPAVYIGRGLAKSESLQIINLAGNPLESSGCYAILRSLIGKDVESNKLERIDLTEIDVNPDFQELYIQVKSKRPELDILIGPKAQPTLSKSGHRLVPTPMERLQTFFQRRSNVDLTDFFYSIATGTDETGDSRITDPLQFKQAVEEKLNGRFSDTDIEELMTELSQFDCKKFLQTFDNKLSAASLSSSSSWHLKS